MLAAALLAFAVVCGFWLTHMVRYPSRWSQRVDRHRQLLRSWGVDLPWMHRMEKGPVMKALLALVTVITLACVVIVLRHPAALQDFWRNVAWP
jgi:tellurite resistance protein TehA-like permease